MNLCKDPDEKRFWVSSDNRKSDTVRKTNEKCATKGKTTGKS